MFSQFISREQYEQGWGKQCAIQIWKAGLYTVMDISDNGLGIPSEMRELLFKHFSGSSGRGLCITRDIAMAHGGGLHLICSNENGREFRLHLPVEL